MGQILLSLASLVAGALLTSAFQRRDDRLARLREAYADWIDAMEQWLPEESNFATACYLNDNDPWLDDPLVERLLRLRAAKPAATHRLLLLESDEHYRMLIRVLAEAEEDIDPMWPEDDLMSYDQALKDRLPTLWQLADRLVSRFAKKSWLFDEPPTPTLEDLRKLKHWELVRKLRDPSA